MNKVKKDNELWLYVLESGNANNYYKHINADKYNNYHIIYLTHSIASSVVNNNYSNPNNIGNQHGRDNTASLNQPTMSKLI